MAYARDFGVQAYVADVWAKGGAGATALAGAVAEERKLQVTLSHCTKADDDAVVKIEKSCKPFMVVRVLNCRIRQLSNANLTGTKRLRGTSCQSLWLRRNIHRCLMMLKIGCAKGL